MPHLDGGSSVIFSYSMSPSSTTFHPVCFRDSNIFVFLSAAGPSSVPLFGCPAQTVDPTTDTVGGFDKYKFLPTLTGNNWLIDLADTANKEAEENCFAVLPNINTKMQLNKPPSDFVSFMSFYLFHMLIIINLTTY
mmetsp:Transcript_19572/g.24711  ORF Transcript_19572/g.24711 Transcript_19572/m.24711 type:complete len:136 (-) Transcript_19572:9-416(-)